MGMVKGEVEAVSTKYDKYSILVNGTWYGTKAEWAKVKPNRGDSVEFDDGGSKFLKKVRILGSSSSSSSAPSTGSSRGGYSQVGVEVGHATNIAIQVMDQYIRQAAASAPEVGSKEYWAKFCEITDTVHDITDAFRTKYSAPRPGSEEAKEAKAAPAVEADVSEDEDLF